MQTLAMGDPTATPPIPSDSVIYSLMVTAMSNGSAAAQASLSSPTTVEHIKSAIMSTSAGRGGIFLPMVPVALAQVLDGTSNTFLCGEKYMDPLGNGGYSGGMQHGDNWPAFCGFDAESVRGDDRTDSGTNLEGPLQDQPGYEANYHFGSPHAGMLNMAFCDGSVHQISYGISGAIYTELGNRADGAAIDASMY